MRRRLRHFARAARQSDGSVLLEALIIIALILITAISLAQILPLELRLQKSFEDRVAVNDRQDLVSSWASATIVPAQLPLDAWPDNDPNFTDFNVFYHVYEPDPGDPDASAYLCYQATVNTDLHTLKVSWDRAQPGESSGEEHCPADLTNAPNSRTLAKDITNSTEPFFTYYSSTEENPDNEITNPAVPGADCVYPPPGTAPTLTADGVGALEGTYTYLVTFVRDERETTAGAESTEIMVEAGGAVVLTDIPLGELGTSKRKIYRQRQGTDDTYHLVHSINDNQTTTYTDNGDESHPDPPPDLATQLQAGRCAKSITLAIQVDQDGDYVGTSTHHFHLILGAGCSSVCLADGAVTNAKLHDPLDDPEDDIADNTIGSAPLDPALATQFGRLSLAANANANYGPNASGEVSRWRGNATSPEATGGGGTLAAGQDSRVALAVDWRSYCRAGYRLEGRGSYTVLNPSGAGAVEIAVRLDGGASAFTAGPTTIAAGDYSQLKGPWETIDFGPCRSANYLLGSANPFLYRPQTKADAAQPFAVVNAAIELRWTPQQDPSGNADPAKPQVVAPKSDSTITANAPVRLDARFLDPDPFDTGRLHFQLCTDADCASPLASGTTADGRANGSLGSWTSPNPLALPGQTYYWRVRGEDSAGATGPWSETVTVRTG